MTPPLPEYDPSKYPLLEPGRYMFRITDPPLKRRFGKAVGIIIKFLSFSDEDGIMKKSSCIIWPWSEEYRMLKQEIIKSANEDDWVGKNFMGEIEIAKHPTKPGQKIQNIINIEPFETKETEEEPEPEPEVEDTTITPPSEEEPVDKTPIPPDKEEGDPGPGEDNGPPKDDEEEGGPPW